MDRENRLDILWAPWRLAYIQEDKTKNEDKSARPASKLNFLPDADEQCFICQAAADAPENDLPRFVVERGKTTLTMLNRFPYNNGHLLITPQRHVARLELLTKEESAELQDRIAYWVNILEKRINAQGFNVGLNLGQIAGAGLPGHLHWHIVPRWSGDANFVTTVGSMKAIPQSLEALWEILRDNSAH